ncbi:Protein phosphatase inhibitor [Aphelenchoides fujianensis]|nr:Protein phosphatase inhibitor [Aphelenchoides fujianensis]
MSGMDASRSAADANQTGGQTATTTESPAAEHLVLRLRGPDRPRVTFTADTVDNEHLGRLKSNCCCIYTAPRQWDDPSTWEQEEWETEHCRGHSLPDPPPPAEDPHKKDEEKPSGEA